MYENKPRIAGILNITEDSFSDGGKFLDINQAKEHSLFLYENGSDILDVGAVSSNPASKTIPAEEEIQRLQGILPHLKENNIPISVDTYNPEVQRYCLRQKVDYINDIRGFPDPSVYEDLADSSAKLIVMHSIHGESRASMEITNPFSVFQSMLDFFHQRIEELTSAGIAKERLILDPGMGFFLGSNPESSLFVLKNLAHIKNIFPLPIMISVSRKSFLGAITGNSVEKRGPATLAAELYAVEQGADLIRTHEPASLRDALIVQKAIRGMEHF